MIWALVQTGGLFWIGNFLALAFEQDPDTRVDITFLLNGRVKADEILALKAAAPLSK